MSKQFAVIRLTVKVDMDDIKEKSFARAMLRRLNVLFAKCNPKEHLTNILNGSKLCDAYEGKQTLKAVGKQHERKVTFYPVVTPVEKPKPETILEQSMEPPAIVAEISGG